MTDFNVTEAEADRLARQEPLALHLPSRGVAIIGCGGVGSWIAYFLALAGVRNLWLWDPDEIAPHNLNRILLPPSTVRQNKAQALAAAIVAVQPECKPVPMGRFDAATATAMELERHVDWVVATTDTWVSRREAKAWAAGMSICYLEAAAEGEWGSITGAPAEFATNDEVRPGYASVPVWVGPCVAAAMMAAAYVLHADVPADDDAFRWGWDRDHERPAFFDAMRQPPTQRGHWIVEFQGGHGEAWERSTARETAGQFTDVHELHEAMNRDMERRRHAIRAVRIPDTVPVPVGYDAEEDDDDERTGTDD
jgi:ThiF family